MHVRVFVYMVPANTHLGSYPSLKVITAGAHGPKYDYDGPKTLTAMVAHLKDVADGTWTPPKDAVMQMTAGTFDAFVADEHVTLIEFFATRGCEECSRLIKEYAKASRLLCTWRPFPRTCSCGVGLLQFLAVYP